MITILVPVTDASNLSCMWWDPYPVGPITYLGPVQVKQLACGLGRRFKRRVWRSVLIQSNTVY